MDTPTATPQTADPVVDFDDALARVFARVERASKDAQNPHLRNKYATLASVDDAIREALVAEHFSWPQVITTRRTDAGLEVVITTHLRRRGQVLAGELPMPVGGKATAQEIGTACTYGRRYALSALLGVCTEDDDGNAASQRQPQRKGKPEQQEVPTEPKSDPLWDAFEGKRSAVARALGVDERAAHERIMDAAGIHHDGKQTDAEVRRMIDAAEALLRNATDPVQEPTDKPGRVTKEQAIAAANAAFREAYKAYVAEAREQGVKPEAWQAIAARGIEAEQWSTEKGSHTVADWMAALHEAERATRALQTGGGQ